MARTSDKAACSAEIFRCYRQSDQTQPRLCRENDDSFHTLRWWLHGGAKRAMDALPRRDRPRGAPRAVGTRPARGLTATCKTPKIAPFPPRDVLERVCSLPSRRVAELLPDRWRALRYFSCSALAGSSRPPMAGVASRSTGNVGSPRAVTASSTPAASAALDARLTGPGERGHPAWSESVFLRLRVRKTHFLRLLAFFDASAPPGASRKTREISWPGQAKCH